MEWLMGPRMSAKERKEKKEAARGWVVGLMFIRNKKEF